LLPSILKLLRVRPIKRDTPLVPRRAHEHVRLGNPWHSVSIVPGTDCCAEARDMVGTRFLSSEAPPDLPLKMCSKKVCTCRYRHHTDRRSERPQPAGVQGAKPPKRRSDDSVSF